MIIIEFPVTIDQLIINQRKLVYDHVVASLSASIKIIIQYNLANIRLQCPCYKLKISHKLLEYNSAINGIGQCDVKKAELGN